MANFFRSVLLRLQNKSKAATTSNQSVTADAGYDGLGTVTITPQQHSGIYTPAANKSNNDMGAVHNNRYVDTSGMIVPSGTKDNSSSPYTSNGTYTVTGLNSYTGVKLAVNVPSPTITSITPLDSQPISMSANSNYKPTVNSYAITGYTRVNPSQLTDPYRIKNDNMYFIENEWGYIISNYSTVTLSSGSVYLTSGKIYKMGVNGFVILDYSTITPSNSSPVSLSNGSFYKANAGGYAISSYSSITPSNSSPVSLASGNFYKPSAAGYAISSYSSITPSASGTSFNAGMILMTEAGYAYLTKPSETTLWTNSSPTTGISNGTLLNLSQSMDNFNYLKFYWRYSVTNEGIPCSIMIAVSDMKKCTNDNLDPRVILGGWSGSANYVRCIKYNSDTSVYCYNGIKAWGSGSVESNPGWIIPTKITGLKMHAIS